MLSTHIWNGHKQPNICDIYWNRLVMGYCFWLCFWMIFACFNPEDYCARCGRIIFYEKAIRLLGVRLFYRNGAAEYMCIRSWPFLKERLCHFTQQAQWWSLDQGWRLVFDPVNSTQGSVVNLVNDSTVQVQLSFNVCVYIRWLSPNQTFLHVFVIGFSPCGWKANVGGKKWLHGSPLQIFVCSLPFWSCCCG